MFTQLFKTLHNFTEYYTTSQYGWQLLQHFYTTIQHCAKLDITTQSLRTNNFTKHLHKSTQTLHNSTHNYNTSQNLIFLQIVQHLTQHFHNFTKLCMIFSQIAQNFTTLFTLHNSTQLYTILHILQIFTQLWNLT